MYYLLSPNTGSGQLTDLYLTGIGRLRPGVTPDEATRELAQLLPRLSDLYPAVTPASLAASELRPAVRALRETMVADVRGELVMLMLTVGFVWLVATANVLNLFLLRAESLQGEVAVARALGARGAALARRFLTEGLVVAIAGGVVAAPLAVWAIVRRFGFPSQQVPRLDEVAAGGALFGAIGALVLVMGLVLGSAALLRASAFTFLYRVVHEGVAPEDAFTNMSQVWVPRDQWAEFVHATLAAHDIDYRLPAAGQPAAQ